MMTWREWLYFMWMAEVHHAWVASWDFDYAEAADRYKRAAEFMAEWMLD